MAMSRVVTENQLDTWVRGNSRDAQGLIVELVFRLVAASSPKPKERRFPLGDSIGQRGPDGFLDAEFEFSPFMPEGPSYWEIGTGLDAGAKATSDYRELTEATPKDVREKAAFIFVTPLSGRRDWEHTWKEEAQAAWLKNRREREEWASVHVIDGTKLIDWLQHCPPVELWLAEAIGMPAQAFQTAEQRWADLRTIGDPPPLLPLVFLANRDEAGAKLKEIFAGSAIQVRLDTRFPNQSADFVAAFVAAMEEETRLEAIGRCLIVSSPEGWNAVATLSDKQILVADFDLDDEDAGGAKLLERARRAGHAVVFSGLPGGVPHPNRVSVPNPKVNDIKEALEQAGYNPERARILAQKSGGNIGSLLRCLQNLSLMPEWAQNTAAADLAVAELLGAWNEGFANDKSVAEQLAGKSYGEWIGAIREIGLRPGTPLVQRGPAWKFVSRYEGWYALGPRLYDEHLDRLLELTVRVLRERDPAFDLSLDQRFMAGIYGKVASHSPSLRTGLAETLAFLGCHPRALSSVSADKASVTAAMAVRRILADGDWLLWASLNDVLPLLAEAAPDVFLEALQSALRASPGVFDALFSQEGDGFTGTNYMTGALWALETLAWDERYLTPAIVLLGELAAKDPGGKWANRPGNSLATILLPWLPQTTASIAKRRTAAATLLEELPDVGWKLLLDLLPKPHQVSVGSRRPVWRESIPADWRPGVTRKEYWDQVSTYADLAVNAAGTTLIRLAALIERLDDLPPPARDRLMLHLASNDVRSLPEADRLPLWTELVDLVARHIKFEDAEWAMTAQDVAAISKVADVLAPQAPHLRHRRLFSERDIELYEGSGTFEEQARRLEERRDEAVSEIFARGGVGDVCAFAETVDSPWRVGIAFGKNQNQEADRQILPSLLEAGSKALVQFAGGFVGGRFRSAGWAWVDSLDLAGWSAQQKGEFLAYLPFDSQTWSRVDRMLGSEDAEYWSRTSANAYEAKSDLGSAVARLIQHGRPQAAIRALDKLAHEKQPVDSGLALSALQAALQSSEAANTSNGYAITNLFKLLQDDPAADRNELLKVEWAYLPLLHQHDVPPTILEERLRDDPEFFCEVIRMVYRAEGAEPPAGEPSDAERRIATNAYRLLDGWRMPPGGQKDGTFSAAALAQWLATATTSCEASGHLKVALLAVGKVLMHAPVDPDGLWIHRAAAMALNAKEVAEMRNGFRMAVLNSRGVFWDTEGREERQLASQYRHRADEVEAAGYHRFAVSLREIADSYDRDAERAASEKDLD